MTATSSQKPSKRKWYFEADLQQQLAPFYHWPPKLLPALKYILSGWSPFGVRIYLLCFAVFIWFFLSPSLAVSQQFSFDWIAQIWGRNLLIMLVVAGGLHLYFYTFRRQKDEEHYDLRPLMRQSRLFHFNDQVKDNIFWTMVSGVGFWSAYESLMLYAYANGYAPMIEFSDNPYWFLTLLFILPWWAGLHFYCQHRLLHIPALYNYAHSWHHKNSNTGPWSGAAMHPLEHLIWLSSVLIFFLVSSHPVHCIFLLLFHLVSAVTSHVGYESLIINQSIKIRLGDFFHQLHHRYCDCNYGTLETPWDQWLDTYHNGTAEGDEWMKQRRRMLSQKKG